MVASEVAVKEERKPGVTGKKVLLHFGDDILGRMLNHLFRFAGFETEARVPQEGFGYDLYNQAGCDVALIDLSHPTGMEELCQACMDNKWEDFPKVVLSSLPVKQTGCRGKGNTNCVVMTKPFKTKELISKIDSFSGMSIEKIRRRIYQYYN